MTIKRALAVKRNC